MIDEQIADYCEVLLDNVIHLDPEIILDNMANVPIAFHIMTSRFIERSAQELKLIASYLRNWINTIKPIYVSDHIARFLSDDNKELPILEEFDYESNYLFLKGKVTLWQELVETTIMFENFPSVLDYGKKQMEFYNKLMEDTKCGLLFDFSNAYISQYNRVIDLIEWKALIKKTHHFHVSGFRISNSGFAIDTHDVEICDDVLRFINKFLVHKKYHKNKTITLEFDNNIEYEFLKNQILKVRTVINA